MVNRLLGLDVGSKVGALDRVGLLVGATVDGREVGILDSVGVEVGFNDRVGSMLGMFDIVGGAEGDAEGAIPHSTESEHGMQTSISLERILASFGFEDSKPLIHWQRGLNALLSSPIARACGSSQTA